MRTVRMRYHVTGGRADGTDWPDMGATLTCEDGEAAELVAYGMADWADTDAPVTPPPPDEPPAAEQPASDAPPAEQPNEPPVVEPPVVEPPADPAPADDSTPAPPPVRASRADWAAHAVGRGADPADVDEMTKAQLISQFGNNGGA